MSLRSNASWYALAFSLTLGCLCSGAVADDKAEKGATGTWKWSFTTQNGQTFETTLKLKQEGEKLTGVVVGRDNNETEIKEGKIKGDDISFQVTRERNGQTFTQKYQGKVSADTIKGKVESEFNGQARSRDWEAKRA